MGQGFLLVCDERNVPEVLSAARAHGHDAKVAGHVDDTRSIRVRSRGVERAELSFPLETTT
jgi:selenophosphate synthetase-related protein